MGLLNKISNQSVLNDGNHLKCILTSWGTYPPSEAEALARSNYRLINVVPNPKSGDLMWIFQYDSSLTKQDTED